MKKILFVLLIAVTTIFTLHSAYTDTIVSSGINATYKRLMFVYQDSLLDAISPIYMGNQQASPLSMSKTELRVLSDNNLSFRDEYNYIESSATNFMSVIAAGTLTLTAPTKLYLGSTSNDIDTNNDFTLGGDLDCVDITITGTMTAPTVACTTGTVSGTLAVTGASTLTGAVAAPGGVTGDLTGDLTGDVTGDVTSTGTSNFADITMTGTISATRGSGTGIAITSNGTIGGTLAVTGTTALTGALSAVGGIKTDAITEYTSANGLTVEAVEFIDGDIKLNGGSNFISFDTDDDTYLYSDTGDVVDFKIGNSDDFTFSANLFTAIDGSAIKTNIISETKTDEGVKLEGCVFEEKTDQLNILAPDGKYISVKDSDDTGGTSHSLTDRDDVYIEGLLEVDSNGYFDAGLTVAGSTILAGLSFSGDNPELSPSIFSAGVGKNFIIHGGDGDTGGDLFLDGGSGTTDGDAILGDRDGNVSINSPLLFPEGEELTCDGDEIAAIITETINYINATANDTITVADGVEGQTISFITMTNASTFDIAIQPANCGWGTETILDSRTSACELIFHTANWYIKSITD